MGTTISAMDKKFIIQSPKLLLVEGSHEEKFFKSLLPNISVSGLQVIEVGGEHSFAPNLRNLPSYEKFEDVISIGIVRDADKNFKAKMASIQDALRQAKLPVPTTHLKPAEKPQISIFIMPNNSDNGALENLCMETVADDPAIRCVDDYFNCLQALKNKSHPNIYKARVQAYLACKDEGDIHMGTASELGYWNFASPALDSLKQFLGSL